MDVVLIADFGSSNVRVHAVDADNGQSVAQHSIKYPILSPQKGFFEHDPEKMWRDSVSCVAHVMAALNGKAKVRALSFSHIGSSLVPMDEHFNATYPCILGMDSRAGAEGEELARRLGDKADATHTSFTCANLSPMAKALYLRKHMPDAMRQTKHFVSIQQYILKRLGLPLVWDATEAGSHSCYDVIARQWSQPVLEAAQIDTQTLGDVVLAHSVVGEITSYGDVAFPYAVPVVIGGHDAVMGTIGLGVYDEADDAVAEVTGSVDVFCFLKNEIFGFTGEQLSHAREGALMMSEPGPLQNTTMCLCGYKTAGALIEWFLREMYGHGSPDAFKDLWEHISLNGQGKVMVNPNFANAGGSISGLDLSVTKYDVYRACIEALTYESYMLLKNCMGIKRGEVSRVRIGGGHAGSEAWVQFRADVCGMTFERMENNEASALGTAVLAAYGVGLYPTVSDAVKHMVRVRDRFVPNPKIHQIYSELLERYIGR